MSGCMRHVWSRKTPRDGSTVADSPSRWPRAETSAPGGWTPWTGWSSCRGSPSRTRLSAARQTTARVFARLICPASSMTRTSTVPAISSRAHSHAVPAARFASPPASASATSSLEPAWPMRRSGQPSPSFAFWIPRTSPGGSSATSAGRGSSASSRSVLNRLRILAEDGGGRAGTCTRSDTRGPVRRRVAVGGRGPQLVADTDGGLQVLFPVAIVAGAGGVAASTRWRCDTRRRGFTSQGTVQPRTESQLVPRVAGRVTWVAPAFAAGGLLRVGRRARADRPVRLRADAGQRAVSARAGAAPAGAGRGGGDVAGWDALGRGDPASWRCASRPDTLAYAGSADRALHLAAARYGRTAARHS